MNGWKPIKTVPPRKRVILWSPPHPRGIIGEMDIGYANMKYFDHPEYKYTHWMPLPEPPKEK